MDIIQCLTCKEKWAHGQFPDHGGKAAADHKHAHPDHDVRVGDDAQLAKLMESA